jgi:RNA polymerase sigma-70 factor (ECF subfamily)
LQAADAADVVQEVFSAVAASVADFRGQRRQGSFRAWLRSITRNKIHDHFRRGRGRPEARGGTSAQRQLLQMPQPPDPLAEADPPEVEDALWRRELELVRAEFEDRSWRAFWRVAVDGQSPAEVADELGMTLDAVYQVKSRVLRRLRQELSDLEPES